MECGPTEVTFSFPYLLSGRLEEFPFVSGHIFHEGVRLGHWGQLPLPVARGLQPLLGLWPKGEEGGFGKKHLVSKPSSAMTSSHVASLNPMCRNGFNCTSGHPLSTGVRLRSDKKVQVTRGVKHGPESRVGMCSQLHLQSPLDFPLHGPFRG